MARDKQTLKTTELQFKVGAIRKLLNHAKNCVQFLPLHEEDQGEQGPGLVLVGELSIYLASNGKDEADLDTGNRMAYAMGMNPADWDDEFELIARKVELVGAKDDVAFFKASDIDMVVGEAEDWEVLRMCIVHDGQSMRKALLVPIGRKAKAW